MEIKKYGHIRPEYLNPQLSTKLYRTTYNYLKRFYSEQIFDEVCNELEMPKSYLLADKNWVSMHFGALFAAKVREKTGDSEVYRKIGQYYLSPENINPFEYSLLRSLSPGLMMKSIRQFYRKSNAVCRMDVNQLGWSHIQVSITSDQPMYPEMAQNTQGVAEAFQRLYDLDRFDVTLKIDQADRIHRFELDVKFSAWSYYLKKLRGLSLLAIFGTMAGFSIMALDLNFHHLITPVMSGLLAVLGFVIWRMADSLRQMRSYSAEQNESEREKNFEIYRKAELLERRYQEATLLKQLSTELVGCTDPRDVMNKTLQALNEKFHYSKAAIFLLSEERARLYLASSVGFEELAKAMGTIEFLYPNPEARDGFIASVLERGETSLVTDLESYKAGLKVQNQKLLEVLQVGSLLLSPLQSKEKKFGVLVVVRAQHEDKLGPSDRFLIENISSQLSLYFESASNFENEVRLRHVFQKYVPPMVLEQLRDQKYSGGGVLRPQKREIVSLFMDLRGFTAVSEKHPPEKIFDLINSFATFATRQLAQKGAIIDNIIGDEIVSFFLADPQNPEGHLHRALEVVHEITKNFTLFQDELARMGLPPMKLGIGLHAGSASVGSVGSDDKMNFTALGRTVNIASRLQSLSKKYPDRQVSLLVTREFIDKINPKLASGLVYESEVLRGTQEATFYICLDQDLTQRILNLGQERAA